MNTSPALQADTALHSVAQKKAKPKKSAAYKRTKSTYKGMPKSR
jgi:hypothetical protein